jgi:hypothetical protein
MFIVGFHPSDGGAKYVPPAGDPSVRGTVREATEKLHEPVPFARKRNPADFGLHPNHWHMNPRSEKFRSGTNEPGHHPGRSFRMLHWDEPSQTIAFGHREVAVHPNGRRRLSVFEAMLLQGFPSEYVQKGTLTDQIRLISDAVPPPLARALALSVAAVLELAVQTSADMPKAGRLRARPVAKACVVSQHGGRATQRYFAGRFGCLRPPIRLIVRGLKNSRGLHAALNSVTRSVTRRD